MASDPKPLTREERREVAATSFRRDDSYLTRYEATVREKEAEIETLVGDLNEAVGEHRARIRTLEARVQELEDLLREVEPSVRDEIPCACRPKANWLSGAPEAYERWAARRTITCTFHSMYDRVLGRGHDDE